VASSWSVAAAVGERKRIEKRSAFNLEPPIAGHRSFPETLWWARRGACHRAAHCADPLAPLPTLRLLRSAFRGLCCKTREHFLRRLIRKFLPRPLVPLSRCESCGIDRSGPTLDVACAPRLRVQPSNFLQSVLPGKAPPCSPFLPRGHPSGSSQCPGLHQPHLSHISADRSAVDM
jgi:hypothetical protein